MTDAPALADAHFGHGKSCYMNFFEAFEKLGVPLEQRHVTFRYDDTNPEVGLHARARTHGHARALCLANSRNA